jgi:NAD(P) transhydrogenase subunit beta
MSFGLMMTLYLISSVLFIMALRGLSSPDTARSGNMLGILGMIIAIAATMMLPSVQNVNLTLIGIGIGTVIGIFYAYKVKMTSLPQMIAIFNGLVGLAAVLLGFAAFIDPEAHGLSLTTGSLVEISLSTIIGAITFTGSLIAFLKLQGVIRKIHSLPFQHLINLLVFISIIFLTYNFAVADPIIVSVSEDIFLYSFTVLAFLLGVFMVLPIGGADMPVVISLMNSLSGWAAVGVGFTLSNPLLIITGALVGASGAILSYIMCKAMNRSFINVLLGGFGSEASTGAKSDAGDKVAKSGNADDAAFLMKNASKVIIIPGYGMAVAQAQHALKSMTDLLKEEGVEIKYAIHPVAGRMPGHMNVLLAEANVPYEDVFALEDINNEFQTADVALVIGANDVTNPVAKSDPSSPIFGMPILNADQAKSVLIIKRSLSPGYAGIDNPLFYNEKTMMLFGDAKEMLEKIVQNLE